MTESNLSGEPDPTLLCPDQEECATNYMDEETGAHVGVYEASGVGAGVESDGFPQCAACGEERSDHEPHVIDVTDEVNRAEDERLERLSKPDAPLSRDELRYMTAAPQDTAWLDEVRLIAEGRHPDPAAFADSVRRLTRIAWTYADRLDALEALADVVEVDGEEVADEDERTYPEYLWFLLTREEKAASE